MQFSDTTNNLGIIQYCEDYCGLGDTGISGDATKLKEFTRYSNRAMRQIWHWIFLAQGLWRYDDSNQTDLPQGTTTLTSAQATYALPDDGITVQRVEIKDENGNWVKLKQLTEDEITIAIEEFHDTDGQPVYYTLLADTIELFPAPNYTQAASLKVYFDRGIVEFANTDTTAVPGFASPYHELVAVGASLEWLIAKRPDARTLGELKEKWNMGQQQVSQFYSMRDKDKRVKLQRKYISSYR